MKRSKDSTVCVLLLRADTGQSRVAGSVPGRQDHEQCKVFKIFEKKEEKDEINDNYTFLSGHF
jgi:hypothetical protein